MIFAVSVLEKPFLRRKESRSSSERATMRPRAVLMPSMKLMAEELAKVSSTGAASWAKRLSANFEWRIEISSKFSTPHRLRFMQTARREKRSEEHTEIQALMRQSYLFT